MPARTHKIRHDDETRAKIKTSQLVNRLIDHVFGKVEMSPSQSHGSARLVVTLSSVSK